MSIQQEIENKSKSTVGYSECEHKESFLTGVNVGVGMALRIFEPQIENLTILSESYRKSQETVLRDIRTMCEIIAKYSNQ